MVNEKSKDSNILKECNQGHADHDNVDVNDNVNKIYLYIFINLFTQFICCL